MFVAFALALAAQGYAPVPCVDMYLTSATDHVGDGQKLEVYLHMDGSCVYDSIEWCIVYDPEKVEPIGQVSNASWRYSGFLPDPDGFNDVDHDGIAVWYGVPFQGVGVPNYGDVATVVFAVLPGASGETEIGLSTKEGQFGTTRALDNGVNITQSVFSKVSLKIN